MIQKLIQLTHNIGPDSSDEILYYLHNEENYVDFINLYFDDIESYRIIRKNIFDFCENNKGVYNPEGDGLTDFIVNSLSTFGILDNFMMEPKDQEDTKSYLSKNTDLFESIFRDNNNSAEIKIKFEGLYNYWLGKSLFNCTYIYDNLENKNILFYLILGDNKEYFEKIFSGNINKIVVNNELKDYLTGILISKILIFKEGIFEDFVLNNLIDIDPDQAIYLFDRDFNLALNILLSPFNNSNKLKYFSETDTKKILFKDLIKNNFNINNIADKENIITAIYNKGFEIYAPNHELKNTNISSYENQYRFIKLNYESFENIDNNFFIDLLYDSINNGDNELINKLITNLAKLEEIKNIIQAEKITANFDKADQIIAKIKDNNFKQQFYKTFYIQKNYPLFLTLETVDEENLKIILKFNTDTEIEKRILDLIDRFQEDKKFTDTYIENLLSENNFDKTSYMFTYSQIIKDLGKGKSDIETIKLIFESSGFINNNPLKIGDFVEFLIKSQPDKYHQLKIIEMFFEIKNDVKQEFFDIIFKNIIVSYLGKRNLVKEFIDKVNNDIEQIIGSDKKETFIDKIFGFFQTKTDIDKLRDINKTAYSADMIDEKNRKLLKEFLDEINEIEGFMNNYKIYFSEIDMDILANDLKSSKIKLQNLI